MIEILTIDLIYRIIGYFTVNLQDALEYRDKRRNIQPPIYNPLRTNRISNVTFNRHSMGSSFLSNLPVTVNQGRDQGSNQANATNVLTSSIADNTTSITNNDTSVGNNIEKKSLSTASNSQSVVDQDLQIGLLDKSNLNRTPGQTLDYLDNQASTSEFRRHSIEREFGVTKTRPELRRASVCMGKLRKY